MTRIAPERAAATARFELICFDFDGTLVNSVEAAIDAFQQVGPRFGCETLTPERFEQLRGLHAREIVRELGLPLYRVPQFAIGMRRAMRERLLDTPPVEGIREALAELAVHGYRIGVMSSNAEDSLRAYGARHVLEGFEFLIGGAKLFGKAESLRRILETQGLTRDQLLYVGDELRDLEAARRAKVAFAAVSWGYTSAASLAAAEPDFLVEHPIDLCDALRCRPEG